LIDLIFQPLKKSYFVIIYVPLVYNYLLTVLFIPRFNGFNLILSDFHEKTFSISTHSKTVSRIDSDTAWVRFSECKKPVQSTGFFLFK
jgi:hypothetical protein